MSKHSIKVYKKDNTYKSNFEDDIESNNPVLDITTTSEINKNGQVWIQNTSNRS